MKLNNRFPALGLLVALAACGTDGEGPTSVEPSFDYVSASAPANVYVCKVDYFTFSGAEAMADGTTALLGSGEQFDIDVGGADLALLEAGDWGVMSGSDGRAAIREGDFPDYCAVYSTTEPQMLEVTENLEADQALKKITVYAPDLGILGFPQLSYAEAFATAGTSQSVTLDLTDNHADGNWFVFFKNIGLDVPDEEQGFEGCTPGYWGRRQHFDSWTDLSTDELVRDIFGIGAELMAYDAENGTEFYDWTLLDAVNQHGNGNNPGQMLRHATSALLNAYSDGVAYPYSSGDIIDMVQDAMTDGTYQSAKNLFADANELGCTLN